ncbi:MAG: glycoside hydrolase family 15 protein [Armatimonadetes bacterium]|nr:glycoside hydrolase family 15 protein [Armatimonadota bacterium]
MPRDIPVGNGRLLINFDRRYQMRDFYFPHVGKENHSNGHPFRFGVWCEGRFAWVHSDDWVRNLKYLDDALVTQVELTHPTWELRLECNDCVDFHEAVYLKQVRVVNLSDRDRELRLFFSHDFHISESEIGDTAYFRPEDRSLVHYKGDRYFFINCCTEDKCGLDQYACGVKEVGGNEGTWRDAEDGVLSGNPIAQGSVDSACAVHVQVPAMGSRSVKYWIAAGMSYEEVKGINRTVLRKTPQEMITRTLNYWRLWVSRTNRIFGDLPVDVVKLFKRSLMILRTHVDDGGAIIAGTDSDIAQFGRDTYCYCWMRDGALVAYALDLAGYFVPATRFYDFCRQVLTHEGYFLHKYNADGSAGSSWHPWVSEMPNYLPIQEDETALVLWALWKHFERYCDVEALKPLYRPLIIRAAEFLWQYRDEKTGLPRPSYDLWEERRGVLSFTTGAVYGGLMAAANFAQAFGESELAEKYQQAASEIRTGTDNYLWRPEANRFARRLDLKSDDDVEVDLTVDASLYGLSYFGLYPTDDPRIVAMMQAVEQRLWVRTPVGGVARYENDSYQRLRSDDLERVPGNPWFICTLWLAQWRIALAQNRDDLHPALEILEWTAAHALPSGALSEQLNPDTGEPVSVCPLTWSHAAYVTVVLEYIEKLATFD